MRVFICVWPGWFDFPLLATGKAGNGYKLISGILGSAGKLEWEAHNKPEARMYQLVGHESRQMRLIKSLMASELGEIRSHHEYEINGFPAESGDQLFGRINCVLSPVPVSRDERSGFAHQGMGDDPVSPKFTNVSGFKFRKLGIHNLAGLRQGCAGFCGLAQLLHGHGQHQISFRVPFVDSGPRQSLFLPFHRAGPVPLAIFRQAFGDLNPSEPGIIRACGHGDVGQFRHRFKVSTRSRKNQAVLDDTFSHGGIVGVCKPLHAFKALFVVIIQPAALHQQWHQSMIIFNVLRLQFNRLGKV
jgi:hypothetical protein